MNALIVLLLAVPPSTALPCATDAGHIQISAVLASARPAHTLTGDSAGMSYRTEPTPQQAVGAQGKRGDLHFYMNLHAQAVGNTAMPSMTPWLELRPIAAAGGHGESGDIGAVQGLRDSAEQDCPLPSAGEAALLPRSLSDVL